MRILVFGGSGRIGSAVVWDLAHDHEVTAIGIVGRHAAKLKRIQTWIGDDRVQCHVLDVADRDATVRLMRDYDVGVLAVPDRRTSYRLVEHAITAGISIVDMLEEYHRRPDAYETEGLEMPAGISLDEYGDSLHERALQAGITFLDGMGFAPGLANITLGQGMRLLDRVDSAVARVGGIPSKTAAERHPLRYMITWSFDHVLREYMVRPKIIQDGRIVEVEPGTGRELFHFGRFGENETLECAITPGMPSFIYTRPQLGQFAEKTVRWPGHWQAVQTLKECGLLDSEPVEFNDTHIVPRKFLSCLLSPRMASLPFERDVSVMYNTLEGSKNGSATRIEYFMWDRADLDSGLSSMQRSTGFPVAIAARMLARGKIHAAGIVAPEDAIHGPLYEEFMRELGRRGILIKSSILDPVQELHQLEAPVQC